MKQMLPYFCTQSFSLHNPLETSLYTSSYNPLETSLYTSLHNPLQTLQVRNSQMLTISNHT